MVILFFHPTGEYGPLSNFSLHEILLGNRTWPSVEHYYQAQKFAGTEREENIRLAATPREAKEMAHSWEEWIRTDWDDVKVEIMREAVFVKFDSHPELKQLLINTAGEELVENSKTDHFWGRGRDGRGANMLGKVLMDVRAKLLK